MPGRAGKVACGWCGNHGSTCDRKGISGVGRVDSGYRGCMLVSLLPCILALSVFSYGIQAPSRTKSTIERRARGVSVWNATDILELINFILAALITLVKKALNRYTFLALSAFKGLLSLQNPNWDDLLSRRGPDTATDKKQLKDAIQFICALCFRIFPELLAGIKLGATSRGLDTAPNLRVLQCWYVHFLSVVASC